MNKSNAKIVKDNRYFCLVIFISTVIILISACLRYRSGEIDYLNSDATWHTLLTIEAYNETPVSQHLFLPIVSLGGADNKWIPWGSALPDIFGNLYYTSFSAMGYFIPWLFLKIFRLSVSEKSLYIFNTVLFAISSCLFTWFLFNVYKNNKHKIFLCLCGGLLYAMMPELLHGMGIVYWHQSVLQVTLLLQIISFYKYAVLSENKFRWLFYILALINPYTEWTGYVANIGFAIAEIIINKDSKKDAFSKAMILAVITVASFLLFTFHYLMRVDAAAFFEGLRNRFMARNVTASVPFSSLVKGYISSFFYVWILLAFLMIWCMVKNKKMETDKGIVCLIIAFPILENFIMKEHAVSYTYDRMKASWIVIFVICELIRNILSKSDNKQTVYLILGAVCLTSLLNLYSYMKNTSYIWQVDYKEKNQMIAAEMTEKYPNALYVSNSAVRGYMNMLFRHGIWEWCDLDIAKYIASQEGKKDIVYIQPVGYDVQTINVYSYDGFGNWNQTM